MKKKLLITPLLFFSLLSQGGIISLVKTPNFYRNDIEQKELSVTIDKKDASGPQLNDGSIKIKVDGGYPPYVIKYFSTHEKAQESNNANLMLNNLPEGTYLFVIQDNNKKFIYKEVNIYLNK